MLRCALHIFSGRIILNFAFGATAFAERSAAMKAPVGLLSGRAVCVSRWRGFAPTSSAERSKRIFTGGVVEKNGICSTLQGSPSQALTRQLSQRESLWQSTQTSSLCQGLSLWERWHRAAMTERARTFAGEIPPQSAHCVRSQLPQGDALWQCRKLCRHC